MVLIDQVTAICDRLAPFGWQNLLLRHGLDITATDLKQELVKPLSSIDRHLPGFEDFCGEGIRGIEPGSPARSLLYHALASPQVIFAADGEEIQEFPSLQELETIENYVFALEAPSILDLINQRGANIAIAVFATEYRPAAATVHRKHADLCFSRTGVARVGTAPASYDRKNRGFLPFVEGDDKAIRVLPCRYAAYIALQLNGDQDVFGPMNFQNNDQNNDQNNLFWVPIHKLFSGSECIRGLDLDLSLESNHLNEKLRRIHLELGRRGEDTGWGTPDINLPPFRFKEGIAEWLDNDNGAFGWLTPTVHPNLIEAAQYQNRPLTFKVPPNSSGFAPSFGISPVNGVRRAPEYVHVRHKILSDGTLQDLNTLDNVAELTKVGDYQAQHYLDFSGDGSIKAICPQLATTFPRNIPAYSLVTAPDFYPNCTQGELLEWWQQQVPSALRNEIWRVPPLTLSEERVAPNLQLSGANFRPEDNTVSAIVSLRISPDTQQRPLNNLPTNRHSHLPDNAAGVFAPGWDTSQDSLNGTVHLAAYGLGSPFPEDAKLCAALSTFWPSVAPDAGRSFSLTFPTVSPMTDEEIIDNPWDGVVGPIEVNRNGDLVVEYANFDYVDYINSTLGQKFSLALTGKVDFKEYTTRILAIVRAYKASNITGNDKANWGILHFRPVDANNGALQQAQQDTGETLQGNIYNVEFFLRGSQSDHPTDLTKVHVKIASRISVFVGVLPLVLVNRNNEGWQAIVTS